VAYRESKFIKRGEKMNEIRRAAGYIRVSTAEQSLKGLSIETQIAEIEAYAKYHNMKLEEVKERLSEETLKEQLTFKLAFDFVKANAIAE
jgi:DNA invertase Pin-like site-specific DNA recombinase